MYLFWWISDNNVFKAYKRHIKLQQISYLNDDKINISNHNKKQLLLLSKHLATLVNHLYVAMIIIPQSLISSVFIHFNAGPSGGHMEEYKTVYIICLQLFWNKLREDVKQWVTDCVHCVSYNICRTSVIISVARCFDSSNNSCLL